MPLLLIILQGCHHREAVVPSEGKTVFERIAVVPFEYLSPDEGREGPVRCPLCGTIFTAERSAGSPEKSIETVFLQHLNKSPKVSVISGERISGIYRRVAATTAKVPLRQILRDVGTELGADAVVMGHVYRFRERQGVSYAAQRPASVAFDIHLLRVEDGAVVWKGHVDRTQSSLLEDLLQLDAFIRQGGRWVTAEELAADGIAQVFKTFPITPDLDPGSRSR